MALTRSLNKGGITPSLLQLGLDLLLQTQPHSQSLRRLSSSARNDGSDLQKPCEFLGSWTPPSDPRVAQANLERLRRAYGKQVRQLRKEYAHEVEMLRVEKQMKDDARREAVRIASEERKKAKAAAAQTRAAEREAFLEEFRQTLMKERAEKLEYWRKKEKLNQEKKAEKRELLRKQSSVWVSDHNLESRILEAIVVTTPL
ncbi:stress response NST1-like protein [Rhynchospora pubera]|uniref:Stress response NST1-like protein n=1 Tax=Rhynchospora pubera TaxID=906938 RepID=A0AAV8CAT4_9POAL|nr:stress response NST1-like protein [Rhynchospora pubera]